MQKMRYFAAYVPIMIEGTFLQVRDNIDEQTKALELDVLGLINLLKPGDELYLMMGSTNAAVAPRGF